MKSVKDRAIDIMWDMSGKIMSRGLVIQMIADESDSGKSLRNTLAAIERGIEADRRDARASVAAS